LDWSEIGWGTLAGVCTGLATLVGALPILLNRKPTSGQQGVMLGFAAGVMISASYLSLIVPAANFAREAGHGPFAAAGIVAISVLAGAVSVHFLKRWERFRRSVLADPGVSPELGRRAWLLTLAMTTHNLPEGAAVGVGFAAGDPRIAISTAVGIGIQNLPEGLAVAAAMLSIGRSRTSAILIAGLTGVVEPIGALLGVTLVSAVHGLLPVGMGWAAGAMLYICAAELIPAVHEDAQTTSSALTAVLIGIAGMLFLDTALSG
jgi:zinc transporter, ZIP family